MRSWTALALLLLFGLTTDTVQAATIRVAQDGTGDFTVIADGVLAATSGDTVSIGPGVYTETRVFEGASDGSKIINEFIAFVQQAELTIIGDDRDTVILGPEFPAEDLQTGPAGIASPVESSFRVQGVTVRNLSIGIGGNGSWMEVSNCRVIGNYEGVRSVLTGVATVKDCKFIENPNRGVIVFNGRGGTGAVVERCTFQGGAHRGVAVEFQPHGCELRDSTFEGGIIGMQVVFGGSALIERCAFNDIPGVGLNIENAQGFVHDCTFSSGMNLNIDNGGFLKGSGNELAGGVTATIRTVYNSQAEFTNNHLLNAGALTIYAAAGGDPEIRTQDFTNNYWGTTDIAQIEEWIHDLNDEPTVNYIQVDYLPIADQPIPTESTSFGEFKARYGGDN